MQIRGSEYNSHKSQLGQVSRKQTGSLAVKDLGSIVSEKDVINTENLITLFVVVPRHQKKDWLATYESIAEYIVSFLNLHPRRSGIVLKLERILAPLGWSPILLLTEACHQSKCGLCKMISPACPYVRTSAVLQTL